VGFVADACALASLPIAVVSPAPDGAIAGEAEAKLVSGGDVRHTTGQARDFEADLGADRNWCCHHPDPVDRWSLCPQAQTGAIRLNRLTEFVAAGGDGYNI